MKFKIGGTDKTATLVRDNFGNGPGSIGNDPGQGNTFVGATWVEYEYTIDSGDSGGVTEVYFEGENGLSSVEGGKTYGLSTRSWLANATINTVQSPYYLPVTVNDYYAGWDFKATISGTPVSRTVTAYNGTTKELTFGVNFDTIPSNYTQFTLTPPVSVTDVSGLMINSASPSIISGSVTPGTYNTSNNFDVTVVFSEAVHAHGTPTIFFNAAAKGRYANYLSGSGTDTLVFRVAVDSDMIAGYGTVRNDPNPSSNKLGMDASNYLDSNATPGLKVYPVTLPTIDFSGVRFNRSGSDNLTIDQFAADTGVKLLSDVITLTAFMSEPAVVNTTGGTPYVTGVFESGNAHFAYTGGSGTSILTFEYTVITNDSAYTPTFGPIVLNGGTIKDVATGTKNVVTTLTSLTYEWLLFKVDTLDPVITTITAPAGTYGVGDILTITMNLNEAVDMQKLYLTRLNITLNGVAHPIHYHYSFTDNQHRNHMKYDYIVQPGDVGPLALVDLDLRGYGTFFLDAKGTELNTTFTPPDLSSVVVDTADSRFGVTSWSIAPPSNVVGNGDVIDFTMNLSKPGIVTGLPTIYSYFASNPTYGLYTQYHSGSGTSAIVFRVTSLGGSGELTLDDTFSIFDNSNKIVNGMDILKDFFWAPITGVTGSATAPVISSVTASANGNYTTSQTIRITVNVDRAVTVVGTPKIGMLFDGDFKWAAYTGKTGTALHFDHIVSSAVCPLGTVICTSNIELNGGSIHDQASPPVNLSSLIFTEPSLSGISTNLL